MELGLVSIHKTSKCKENGLIIGGPHIRGARRSFVIDVLGIEIVTVEGKPQNLSKTRWNFVDTLLVLNIKFTLGKREKMMSPGAFIHVASSTELPTYKFVKCPSMMMAHPRLIEVTQ